MSRFTAALFAFVMISAFIAGCVKTEIETVEKPQEVLTTARSVHNSCAEILAEYVDDQGRVDYKALKRDKAGLKAVLEKFAALDAKSYQQWSKPDKIAFWLNVYNLQLLKIIVDNYPIEASRIFLVFWPPTSIRHINKKIDGIDRQKFVVMDEEFTLREIEDRLFREQFDEPRAFFALSRASVSGPALRNEPYYGQGLGEQLDVQVGKFLSNSSVFRIDRAKAVVYLPAILRPKWFGREFIGKYGTDKRFKDQQPEVRAVLNFIKNYLPRPDVDFLELENYTVRYINYDWRLNE